jgi:hypothetical protein
MPQNDSQLMTLGIALTRQVHVVQHHLLTTQMESWGFIKSSSQTKQYIWNLASA